MSENEKQHGTGKGLKLVKTESEKCGKKRELKLRIKKTKIYIFISP